MIHKQARERRQNRSWVRGVGDSRKETPREEEDIASTQETWSHTLGLRPIFQAKTII